MRKIVIATHGNYADGIVSAIHIIIGDTPNITCFNTYTKDKNLKKAIDAYFMNVVKEDEVIILTDLFGGSVNQAFMPYSKLVGVYVIAGFNLALLLEVVMLDGQVPIDIRQLRTCIEGSKKQIILVNDVLQGCDSDDFE